MDRPCSQEGFNRRNAPKSGASRTSISVKLPTAGEDGRKSAESEHLSTAAPKESLPLGLGGLPGNIVINEPFPSPTSGLNFPQHFPATDYTHRYSSSDFPNQPRRSSIQERKLLEQTAASIIERAWISYRDRHMFRLLKHAVCAAENSLTSEILRKVSPKEASLLTDKSLQIRVRFRFGGCEFPPMIFFKIFMHTNGTGVKYISGKRVIKPDTEAAEDSLKQMGNRLFYDQILQDNIYQKQFRVTDEVDVTTLKDYMQYLANLDETPAYKGGKENYWRKLTLDDVPRHTMFYDIVDYLYSHRISDRLRAEVPLLMVRPINQGIQRQHIKIVSQFRPLPTVYTAPVSTHIGSHPIQYTGTERRSRQARLRAKKMRKAFGISERGDPEYGGDEGLEGMGVVGALEGGDDDWEDEANKLYEWTQELSFEDIAKTPRVVT
ncbi:uncharacterized protein CXorf58-like [Liolophura sinensis]|uniref:uncharacterized protein CXorf58-like n=1 Tax=Liolophura sinensis TaxID=3198878 RepID=UPI003159130F